MLNDGVVKCPLCGGFTHIEKRELLAALKNTRVREQVGKYIRELLGQTGRESDLQGSVPASHFRAPHPGSLG